MSDPRLQGDAFQTYESDEFVGSGVEVVASTLSIVNEDGAWASRRYHSTGTPAEATDTGSVFICEGAYEGLIAVMSDVGAPVSRPEGIAGECEACAEVRGIIVDGSPVQSRTSRHSRTAVGWAARPVRSRSDLAGVRPEASLPFGFPNTRTVPRLTPAGPPRRPGTCADVLPFSTRVGPGRQHRLGRRAPCRRVDEPPVVNGRVSSRELYTAISSLREELGSAQRAQAADVMAAVAATEHHLSTRIDRLEATVSGHDDLIQQLRRRGAWSRSSSASRSSRPRSAS